ncbi:MAG: YhdP family protein [Methylococcaceae bacterium]|nr:YhdP family protein [Methylococcaceae bacterium]
MKIIPHITRATRYILFCVLVGMALGLSAIRFWLLPQAEQWREELQTRIGVMIGETVSIRTLSAGMQGFDPVVNLRHFRIENADPSGPAVEFERLGVRLNLLRSLLSAGPVINRIELEGSRLLLTRKPDGTVGVVGLKPGEHPPLWLFADGEVRLTDIDLAWVENPGNGPMPLGRAQVKLVNGQGRHVLDARMDLPGKLGKSLKLSAEVEGDVLQDRSWSGRLYLEAKHLREGLFVASLPVRLRSGEAGLQAWAQWRDGRLQQAVGHVDLDRPVFVWRTSAGAEGMVDLDKVEGWLNWVKEEQGWRLDVRRFNLALNGQPWPQTDLALAISHSPAGDWQSLRAAINYLHFDDTYALLSHLPWLDDKTRQIVEAYSPQGEVHDGRLVVQADGGFGFCGDLSEVGLNPVQGFPGISRFSGRVCGSDRQGRIDLNMAKAGLNAPAWFKGPILIDSLKGSMEWTRLGGAATQPGLSGSSWRIRSRNIELAAPGLQVSSRFALELPVGEGALPELELNASLRDVEVARLRDYLPLRTFNAVSAQWLDDAFHAGKVNRAEALFRGKLADFPFAQGEGLFEVQIDAQNMELDFNPQWPHLYETSGRIILFGPTLFVESQGGRIGEIPLQAVHAETSDFVNGSWLDITGELPTHFPAAMRFLQQTPVRYIPERLFRAGDPQGDADLAMKLHIPLTSSLGDVAVDGTLRLKKASLDLKAVDIKFENIEGELHFTELGMDGRQIAAQALEAPILMDVTQARSDILLDITGKVGVTTLRKTFPRELWNYADGAFDYRLNLEIPQSLSAESDPMRVVLVSDLSGLEFKLPAPLSKPAAVKKDLRAEMVWRSGNPSSLNLSYGHEGKARLSFVKAEELRWVGGDLAWGKPLPPGDGETGWGFSFKADELDVDAWRKLAGEGGGSVLSLTPRLLDVEVGKLRWNGEEAGHLRITGTRQEKILSGELDCQYAKGRYSLTTSPSDRPDLKLDLDRLDLPDFTENREGKAPSPSPDPAGLPGLQLHAAKLLRQGRDLGVLDLEIERWTAGLSLKRLSLRAPNHELNLRGSWMRQEGHDETQLAGKLKIRDLGGFLSLLGYGKEVQGTPADAAFSLVWNDAPQEFSAPKVKGDIRLKLGRGSILQVEPGLGRALGMLNLYTLRRLLLLDFSDLFGKGLAYDSMEGSFHLEEGQAVTQGFAIDAVAANILMIGRVGLVAQDFDERVSVMPHALATIPFAGAVVGGAAVGAAIDMAHWLVGEEDVNIGSTNYSIKGSWDNPQFKRVEGNIPLDMLGQAWSSLKDLSGLGSEEEENKQ